MIENIMLTGARVSHTLNRERFKFREKNFSIAIKSTEQLRTERASGNDKGKTQCFVKLFDLSAFSIICCDNFA